MKDLSCLLAGLINLCGPMIMLTFWSKKTGARSFPAVAAFLVCFPVFIMGNAIRSGFDHSNAIFFYIQQGLLFGVLEECTKYLMMRYALTSYDNRKDAVTYSIGHNAYEELGIGIRCLGLIGTGNAAPDILIFQALEVTISAVSGAAVAVIIFYGIQSEKYAVTLLTAILTHTVQNAAVGIFIEPVAILLRILIDAALCYVGYRCWRSLKSPFDEDY